MAFVTEILCLKFCSFDFCRRREIKKILFDIFVYSRLYDTAIRLGELQAGFNLQINPEEYATENLKFGLVEVVYEWAKVCFWRLLLI